MPYKFNERRRHKIPKARYRVANWLEYDAALARRGSLTIGFTEEAVAAWHAPATGERGGQPVYSSLAIETALALRLVFHQPLRQTEGMLRSIAEVPKIDVAVPDHTTLSRRGCGVTIMPKRALAMSHCIFSSMAPAGRCVDGTGLKMYGEGEWLDRQRGLRSRRWGRKLHLGLDAETQEIVAAELTPDDIGDASVLPELLSRCGHFVNDRRRRLGWRGCLQCRGRTPSGGGSRHSTPRHGRSESDHDNAAGPTSRGDSGAWTYRLAAQFRLSRRSLVETAMYRYKTIIGRRLHARILPNQRTEAKIACNVVNRMTWLGMPVTVRVA